MAKSVFADRQRLKAEKLKAENRPFQRNLGLADRPIQSTVYTGGSTPLLITMRSAALYLRCQKLADRLDTPVLLWSGTSPARNFAANTYPFRASSHFLYFTGLPLENAVIHLAGGQLTLFWDEPPADAALWHGAGPTRDAIAEALGAAAAYPLAALAPTDEGQPSPWAQNAATIGLQNLDLSHQQAILGRPVGSSRRPAPPDVALARAIVALRMIHDDAALAEMRQAAAVTVAAHRAGMAGSRSATQESQVRATMEAVIQAQDMTTAYSSIVTVHGEVLHNNHYHHAIAPGDLILADVGAETAGGWAADVTRTWPASGQFSPTQRDLYQVVWAAQQAAIAAIAPGVEYRDIHLLAGVKIAEGLVELGILKGKAGELADRDAHALFFPHGIGHLLGLDVHDMEDLGDLAGYAEGRHRSERFGLGYLRLDRPLQPGMVVTIEPGFYQVPALLNDPVRRAQYADVVDWDRLEQFADVRGIRIEDDVLVTATGAEVLTAALPSNLEDIECRVRG
jgi:Xaa-Pro aminopeptidase